MLIVFLPMALGYATQRTLVAKYGQKTFAERFAPRFPALSTLGVLGIVFIALALKGKKGSESNFVNYVKNSIDGSTMDAMVDQLAVIDPTTSSISQCLRVLAKGE